MKAAGRLKTGIFERVNCLGRCSVPMRAGLLPQRRMQEEPPPVPFSVLLFFVSLRSLEANAIGSLPLLADPALQYARRAKSVARNSTTPPR
jgi:hypothetical protein